MRFWRLRLEPQAKGNTPNYAPSKTSRSGNVWTMAARRPPKSYAWSSHPDGLYQKADPGALDIQATIDALDMGGTGNFFSSSIILSGLDLNMLKRAQFTVGSVLTLEAGFGSGLPLANASQAGVVFQGLVMNAIPNWDHSCSQVTFLVSPAFTPMMGEGDKPTGINIAPGASANAAYKPLVLHIPSGTSFTAAIRQTVLDVFPNARVEFDPSMDRFDQFKSVPFEINGLYKTVQGLALDLRTLCENYWGYPLRMRVLGNLFKFSAQGGGGGSDPVKIAPEEIIGNLAGFHAGAMKWVAPLRADLHLGDVVRFPARMVPAANRGSTFGHTLPEEAGLFAKSLTTYSGDWSIRKARHVMSSRSPRGEDWSTTFELVPETKSLKS